MAFYPSVSIIIPVYNSEKSIALCLDGVRKQNYPKEKIETIIVDAGSTDKTIEIIKKYEVTQILSNPLKTGEAGKSVGVENAHNEIVALIDSDNIIDEPNWLERMVQPFADSEIGGSEPWIYTYRSTDPLITRYCALLGMNDPLCFYLGNYDRVSQVNGRWTDLQIPTEDKGEYLKVNLENQIIYPTIGANGFLVRRALLLKTHFTPYLFDIDIVSELVPLGYTKYAKVKNGIVHLYAKNLRDFARKQKRRVKDFLYYQDKKQRYYPWDKISKMKIVKFVIYTVLVVPLVIDIIRGYLRISDRAWWFHIPACWTTLLVYGTTRILALFTESKQIEDRKGWNRS